MNFFGNWKLKIGNFCLGLSKQAGFTFIELVMVISLFSILTGVVLANFGAFTENIALSNMTQQIALEIKRAQSDAISGRDPLAFGPSKPSYGVYFKIDDPIKFIYFADLDNDGFWDGQDNFESRDNSFEGRDIIELTRGNLLEQICFKVNESCETKDDVHITFRRPFPNAKIISSDSNLGSLVEIKIKSPRDKTRSVIVSSLGQISVK